MTSLLTTPREGARPAPSRPTWRGGPLLSWGEELDYLCEQADYDGDD